MPDDNGNTNWSDVKRTIAIRLNRPDLDPAFIQFLAEEVVSILMADGFWPSEQTNLNISTQNGQYFYLLPRGITTINMVRLLLSNVWIPLSKARSYEDILMADPVQPNFTAIPSTARAFGRLLRVFPTPNAQYQLELTVDQRISVPTDDNDTQNFWVDEGRPIIVNRVCEYYCINVIHNYEWAAGYKSMGDLARDSMDEITHTRNGPTIVRPYL